MTKSDAIVVLKDINDLKRFLTTAEGQIGSAMTCLSDISDTLTEHCDIDAIDVVSWLDEANSAIENALNEVEGMDLSALHKFAEADEEKV